MGRPDASTPTPTPPTTTEHGLRVRDLAEPGQLRALANPRRLAVLDLLLTAGPMTASACAERLHDSRASCSYHLRQLARFGFVEEAEGGTGRQRPWKAVPSGNRFDLGGSPARRAAAEELLAIIDAGHLERLRAFRAAQATDAWVAQGAVSDWPLRLTEAELGQLNAALEALLAPLVQRTFDGAAPEGARVVDVVTQVMPRALPHA